MNQEISHVLNITLTEEQFQKLLVVLSNNDNANDNMNTPIANCGFTTRTYNCLLCTDIKTVSDLYLYKKEGLMQLRNFGIKSLHEIEYYLEDNKLPELN